MYRVVLADDEAMMRKGLCELIPWAKLGFEVAGVFADGPEVMDFLGGGEADVVLADIRMRDASGLDVARYVHENSPEIKVVLLSGHQDFDFAREAIRFGVAEYLLKPISISNFCKVFSRLREQLDEEARREDQAALFARRYREMCLRAETRFFSDALLGALNDPARFEDRRREVGLEDRDLARRSALADVRLLSGDDARSPEEAREQVLGALQTACEGAAFYELWDADAGAFRGVFFEAARAGEAAWQDRAAFEARMAEAIFQWTGQRVRVRILAVFDSLVALARHADDVAARGAPTAELLASLGQHREWIWQRVSMGDADAAIQQFGLFCRQAGACGGAFLTDQALLLFAALLERAAADDPARGLRLLEKCSLTRLARLEEGARRAQCEKGA